MSKSILPYFKVLIFFLVLALFISCHSTAPHHTRYNGISFVAPADSISGIEFETLKIATSANCVAIMPFAFNYGDGIQTDIHYNSPRQWWGESLDGTIATIRMAHKQQLKVMLKSQIWLMDGQFTGHIQFDTDSLWLQFEKNYSAYILDFAKIAEKENVELFCIGTEMHSFIEKRSDYWFQLIDTIQSIYKGKITYASNWDEYSKIPIWEKLDFIGIDAYFPVSDLKNPSKSDIFQGLKAVEEKLAAFSKLQNKEILFTEYGYRSMNFALRKPWESSLEEGANFKIQSNAMEAFYNTFWNKKYIAGGFLWKWFHYNEKAGGMKNSGFTPQNKPALKIIEKYYSN